MAITDQERAEKSAEAMWASDDASKWFGMSLDAVGPGTATMSLTVRDCQTNGHDICHGGVIFALADSAFAFACNSYNKVTVAQSNSITFAAPARTGDRLVAEAREVVRSGRSGTWDVTVTNQDGTVIALFRGLARTVSGTLFSEE
ncbi:hydroxyphenylacetyl-CoA thioesterase PaaI [Oricola thermophila]|uniref:Hydroxyphenylacetyl-CoA thioesterase PaaI n=1 Tax=Oricola thermophila TaxID=2742145 RepID=A0A6N1VA96_9HYPH|nr:hydroxyphenylacetyl-CoA thioesterase PaaI [Oricola thermophila]QKV17463.1 hydroxyphenylacetyl-CoA thioesterase PaaI [Oricola thermophila]